MAGEFKLRSFRLLTKPAFGGAERNTFLPMRSSRLDLRDEGVIQQKHFKAGHQWHSPVILATWEAQIRRIEVQSLPRKIVHKTLS
jgi:hypothetical protein